MSEATPEQLKLLETWVLAEYALRTHAIEANVPNVDWAHPEYRVSLTEIQSKAQACGIPADKFQLAELMTRLAPKVLRRRCR